MRTQLPGLWGQVSDRDHFRDMQRHMDDLLTAFGGAQVANVGAAAPAMNIAETADGIEITAELPGMDENDVTLSLDGHRLTIAGEKKIEAENKEKAWHVVERRWGAFQRSVSLPFEPKQEAIEAHVDKGVLHVSVKKPEAQRSGAASIPIKATKPAV